MTIVLDRPQAAPEPEVASDQLVVDVTQQDIDGALRDPRDCPIARALLRLGYASTFVGIGAATVDRRGYRLDAQGRALVRAFDNGRRVEPTRVTLTPF